MTIEPAELLSELQAIAPEAVERAALRVANRKLAGRVAELEAAASDVGQTK
jgi:hypothetical protein